MIYNKMWNVTLLWFKNPVSCQLMLQKQLLAKNHEISKSNSISTIFFHKDSDNEKKLTSSKGGLSDYKQFCTWFLNCKTVQTLIGLLMFLFSLTHVIFGSWLLWKCSVFLVSLASNVPTHGHALLIYKG